MPQNNLQSFKATIVNRSGENTNYYIENVPDWLTVDARSGSLRPLTNKELTFTVSKAINVGYYETAIELRGDNNVRETLPVMLKITGSRPDWSVNPGDFKHSMNITGQIKIAGVFQEDTDDLLAAFIGERCVGLTSPIFSESNNAYFTFATIYGNDEHNNQPLSFKLWDASTGRIYPKIETSIADLRFSPSTLKGSLANPVIFNALNVAEQIIPLQNGWNWISINVMNDNPSILNQMKSSLTYTGIMIKGQDEYLQQPNWMGTLTSSISEKSMYKVNTNSGHTLLVEGKYADPSKTAIAINEGWNWIAYVPSFSLPVKSALAGVNAQVGDIIKGQTDYALYSGAGGWIGSLTTMEPGKGYMYFSDNATSKTLIYPSESSAAFRSSSEFRASTVAPKWSVNNKNRFSGSMTVTAIVVNDNLEMQSENVEIAAFSGNDCRGSAFLQYEKALERYICYLMVYGEGGEEIRLRVYDHGTNKEYAANNSPMTFIMDNIYGSPNLYIVAIGTTTNINNEPHIAQVTIYPNPVSDYLYISREQENIDILVVTDLIGRNILLEKDFKAGAINVSSLAKGTYLLRLTMDGRTVVMRFMRK
jgi:hypothetical protein